jgi:hypothetical protein
MATVAARRLPTISRVRLTGRVPAVLGVGVLIAVSLYVRSRVINGSFWMDEGLSVGIASHHFFDIPSVLHQDGSPPLYYLLLHLWMSVFGRTEADTHALSLLFAVLMIPAALWAGWTLFGRRAGWIGAVLAALNPFLTAYAQETRMYSLMALLGLLTGTFLVQAYVRRNRRYLPLVAVGLAAMLYTHGWGLFFAAGSVIAMIPLWRRAPDRRAFVRDFLLGFGGAALLFSPWLPTLLYQAAHTGAPWGHPPRFGVVIQISRGLLGGDRASVGLLLAAGVGIAGVVSARRGGTETRALSTLGVLILATLAVAWVMSQISPAWTVRYFAAVIGPLFILIAAGLARSGRLGFVALALVAIFWINPKPYTSSYKSDVRDIAATLRPQLHPGDLVIVGQPEQVPVVNYYMPPGLRYADTIGPVADPGYMNWADALDRLKNSSPAQALQPLLASLRPGQHVVLVRPITDGVYNWTAPWTLLVRRRSAQWSQLLATDKTLKHTANAPPFYHTAATVGNSAVVYTKTG